MTPVRPIKDEASYDAALAEVEAYFVNEPKRGTPEADRFMVLTDLITAYEARRWPIPVSDPIDFLLHAMEMTGRTQNDLAALIGSHPRASEILNRKRRLTMGQVFKITSEWRLPAEPLIAPYELSA
jgi:HTH-type transcriptional regulator/antitoxin HigA